LDFNLRKGGYILIVAGILGGVFNLLFWLAMFTTQHWLWQNEGIPPRTKKFFYLQDFNSSGWGDLLGVTLIDIGASIIVAQTWDFGNWPAIIFACMLGISIASIFQYSCTRPSHKPDWGYPSAGETSLGGWIHLVYLGFQYAFGLFGLMLVYTSVASETFSTILDPFLISMAGAAIYVASLIRDVQQGNFVSVSKSRDLEC
jgi:hypothetical protein